MNRLSASLNILLLLCLVINLGAQFEVISEKVISDLFVFESLELGPKVRIDKESDVMPSILCLVERMNESVTVESVLILSYRTIVHCRLCHIE